MKLKNGLLTSTTDVTQCDVLLKELTLTQQDINYFRFLGERRRYEGHLVYECLCDRCRGIRATLAKRWTT